ncbi:MULTISPECIES: hypothetical protein [Chryseobacterium]|uniref:Uncharacterized protein n=2 Tax=Chryseobacterium TaxID=59732 RepID=A0A6N4X7J1_9FLAO|nr:MULTISPECIES: hypothetical protein [Chryseobacterium]RMZ58991.1 hypothetical protein D1632_15610 [Chryseobacterium nematophagum]CAA7195417.1 hypothetical protein CHRY9293_01616 [Chryseobacterium potabilaquae]
MKKVILFFGLFMVSLYFSQTNLLGYDIKYFVGDDLELLKGKYLIALPKNEDFQKFGFDYLYTSEEMNHSDTYKRKKGHSGSNYIDVVDKKFLLTDYKKIDKILGDYILLLKDEEGNSVYFLYDSKTPSRFPFKTSEPLIFPEEHYCSKIDIKKDKFTNKITKYSPLLEPISFVKNNGYFISLKTYGSTPVVDGTGVIILLSNGQKIKKTTKIDIDISSGKYKYSAFIPLTTADINLLTKNIIDDFKLYIFENVQKLNGEAYKEYLKCIIKPSL